MSISPQQHQKKQLQQRLLNDALAHGPYLWNDRDVNNALLWFPPEVCSHSQNIDFHAVDAKSDERGGVDLMKASDHDESGTPDDVTAHHAPSLSQPNSTIRHEIIQNESGHEFLRRLIQSRGIWMPRPLRLATMKKEKKTHNGKRGIGKGESGEGGERKKKRRTGSGGEKVSETSNAKRSAIEGTTPGIIRGPSVPRKQSAQKNDPSPLSSILMGYYKLHDLSKDNISTFIEKADDVSDNRESAWKKNSTDDPSSTKLDGDATGNNHTEISQQKRTQCSPTASTKLLNDVASIILERQHTSELYREILNDFNNVPQNNARFFTFGLSDNFINESAGMNHLIDRYMTHPTTCLRRVYASNLYDRLLSFSRKKAAERKKLQPHVTMTESRRRQRRSK